MDITWDGIKRETDGFGVRINWNNTDQKEITMKGNRVFICGVLLFAGACASQLTQAYAGSSGQASVTTVDCSLLSGTPYVCVRNDTAYTITNVSCVSTGMLGGKTPHPLSLPGGRIARNEVAIVKFERSSCSNTISVEISGHNPRVFNGFDVNTNTLLSVETEE